MPVRKTRCTFSTSPEILKNGREVSFCDRQGRGSDEINTQQHNSTAANSVMGYSRRSRVCSNALACSCRISTSICPMSRLAMSDHKKVTQESTYAIPWLMPSGGIFLPERIFFYVLVPVDAMSYGRCESDGNTNEIPCQQASISVTLGFSGSFRAFWGDSALTRHLLSCY